MLDEVKIVRLLVREKSGSWYVDQGYMPREMADIKKKEWNKAGYGILMLKHTLKTVRIVTTGVNQNLAVRWCNLAWLRWIGTGSRRRMVVCNSDDQGAFRVYRRVSHSQENQ